MWCLKHRRYEPKWRTIYSKNHIDLLQSTLSNKLKAGGLTLGMGDDIGEETDGCCAKYSIGLNALIKECLLIQPPNRPSPELLVARTKRGLEMCYRNAGMSLAPVPASGIPQNLPSSRWFSQDPHPIISDEREPQRTLPLSVLIHRVGKIKLQKEWQARKMRVEKKRSWGIRLNLRRRASLGYRFGGSVQRYPNPFSSSTALGGMQDSDPIISPGIRVAGAVAGAVVGAAAGIAADIGAGIGAGLGAGLETFKDLLVDAINSPPHKPNDDWEFLTQETKDKANSSTTSNRPPNGEALIILPVLYCIVMHVGMFGQINHTHIKLTDIYEDMTILQLKAKLMAEGVAIPLNRMKVTCGIKELNDNDKLTTLNGQTIVRVEKE